MPSAMSVHCFAHLNEDVGEALPFLNASLGGHIYIKDPPSVTFKVQGKLITVHSKKIAINALKDEEEATKILEWLKGEINAAWENRGRIEPSYVSAPRPKVFEILKQEQTARVAGSPPAWSSPLWWQRVQNRLKIVLRWMMITVRDCPNILAAFVSKYEIK